MDRKQAVEIQKHLLEADRAMDHARMAIAGLGKDERIRLDGLLRKVSIALHSKLLAAIYDQYPDLEPSSNGREIPTITSRLRWDQVRLPPMALKRCEELALPISGEALAARIQVLAKSGCLEDVGDLRKWRHGEVRLKD
jgi:hypothetical protein